MPNQIPFAVIEQLSLLMLADPASVDALGEIAKERRRQVEDEGWTPDHDNEHQHGEMAKAAACYAAGEIVHGIGEEGRRSLVTLWPWDRKWWKPQYPHRNHVRAGALLVAEMARRLRANTPREMVRPHRLERSR